MLANLGLGAVRELLFHFPRGYEDRSRPLAVAEAAAREGDTVTIEAEVTSARSVRLRGKMSLAVVTLSDGTGTITATFFGRGFLARTFTPGARGFFTGVVGSYKGPALKNPEYELLSGDADEDRLHAGRVVPIYRLTQKVTHRMLRGWIAKAIELYAPLLEETLPEALRRERGFPPIAGALRTAHFPETIEAAQAARARFAYEELLGLQLGVLSQRAARIHEEQGLEHHTAGPKLEAFRAGLPFTLTPAQARAVEDVLGDMASPRPMLRLVQGDVGCGKTVVAVHAIAAAADGGFQTAVMAPTEVLAEQHYASLRAWLEPLGLRVGQLTGSMRGAAAIRREIARGGLDVAVGTHALVQEKTAFHRLGLAVVDEQHRFGVLQRSALAGKGLNPDVLHMTATPIPRTLAITVYGGMDVTVIDALPPGRLPVRTRRIPDAKLPDLYDYVTEQAKAGFQTYLICPLVEESDKRAELTAVTTHFEELSAGPFAGLRTALLHGRLDGGEKDDILYAFKEGRIDVLFSTTVIEVGIDAPNATSMIIENAGQFGLTQLHQLRGRVGRGAEQSFCFLLGPAKTKDAKKRLDTLCRTSSGFEIAEADLTLRGPGEFFGVRQAGLTDLRAADLIRDVRLLDRARRDAQTIIERDPRLEAPELAGLLAAARRFQALNA